MDLEALTAAIDELVGTEPTGVDGDDLRVLVRELSRVEAHLVKAVGEFDTWGTYALDGAKGTAPWLRSACRMQSGRAARLVKRARTLPALPVTSGAYAGGVVSGEHLDTLCGVRNPRTDDALSRDEGLLCGIATEHPFGVFSSAVATWEQLADPDGTEDSAEERRARRDVSLVQSFSGTWLGQVTLDPVSGAIVSGELDRIGQALFEADWAEAEARLGHAPQVADLRRTAPQRRADALVEMATRSASAPDTARRPAPLFSVLVDFPTLCGRVLELANGTAVTPGDLLPWLTRADLERAVFTPSGRVEVSATSRFFTGALRRAIELRDRRCRHPSCDEPAHRCEVDHIVEYARGGPTTQENGRMLCSFHNRLRNRERPPPDGAG